MFVELFRQKIADWDQRRKLTCTLGDRSGAASRPTGRVVLSTCSASGGAPALEPASRPARAHADRPFLIGFEPAQGP